jgi:hypothetical protein
MVDGSVRFMANESDRLVRNSLVNRAGEKVNHSF